jgi:hypothetical protein
MLHPKPEPLQEAVRMDHLEVVKLMESSGGKVWEDGQVRRQMQQPGSDSSSSSQAVTAAAARQ